MEQMHETERVEEHPGYVAEMWNMLPELHR